MEEGPSRTSMLAAIGRGMHRDWHMRPWVLDDPYALSLAGPGWPNLLAAYEVLLPRRPYTLERILSTSLP